MKLTKLFTLVVLLGLFSISCSSDNDPISVPKPDDFQKEVSKEMTFTGNYVYTHAGNPIPFVFEQKTISMKMSEMGGSNSADDVYEVITVYQNKAGNITKAVAKNKDAKEYKAFFFKNIANASLDINIDYSFPTEIEAINVSYPSEQGNPVDHTKNQFGWLKLTNSDTSTVVVNLPIEGKYIFEQQGHSYYYTFSNTVVNFNGSYDMQVLKHNTNTNKILLKGIEADKSNTYYVIQLNEIEGNNVLIARATYNDANAKADAETEFASATELAKAFSLYTKEASEVDYSKAFPNLVGTYETVKMNNGIAQYRFKMGNNDEAFLFMVAEEDGTMEASASLKLKRVFADEKSGQLIYKITSSNGYYSGRDNQFLTIYAKGIATNGSSATFAIATKDGSGSIAASKGNIIGQTLEEAKLIVAPENDKLWGENMMVYAHVWIKTIRS